MKHDMMRIKHKVMVMALMDDAAADRKKHANTQRVEDNPVCRVEAQTDSHNHAPRASGHASLKVAPNTVQRQKHKKRLTRTLISFRSKQARIGKTNNEEHPRSSVVETNNSVSISRHHQHHRSMLRILDCRNNSMH
jgi:hypothetical protein